MERIWVDPREIDTIIYREEVKAVTGIHRSKASGCVVDWKKIKGEKPLMEEFRVQYCFKHWKEGMEWDEIGVYDYMSNTKMYGNWPREKITARFKMLDKAYEEAKKTGRLKTRNELQPSNFREKDGILVHIGKNGKPIFGGNGFHRLAIAKVLELDLIPACIGIVDKESIKFLDQYRRKN